MYRLSDAESGISARELQALFSSLSLGFSPADVAKLYSHASGGNPTLSAAAFASTFTLPPEELGDGQGDDEAAQDAAAAAAAAGGGLGDEWGGFGDEWGGVRVCPPDKWECSVAKGGCSYFNPKTLFYCDMCSKVRSLRPSCRSVLRRRKAELGTRVIQARPDLAAVRF